MGTIAKVRKHTNADLKIDGILLTLVDGRTNLAKSTVEALRENFGSHIRIYRSMIPVAVKAAEVSSKGTSIYAYEPNSPVSKAYANFTKDVPNIVAMFKGDKIRGTLVDTALFGAIFVLVCDMVARVVIAPYELPIELIVGIIGSVLFIGLLLYRLKHGRKAIRLGAAHSGACASAVSQGEGGRGQ